MSNIATMLELFYIFLIICAFILLIMGTGSVKKTILIMDNGENATVFTGAQMFYHKFMIILMLSFIVTGAALYSGSFSSWAYILGLPANMFTAEVLPREAVIMYGVAAARSVHRLLAVIFIISAIFFAIHMLRQKRLNIVPRPESGWGDYIKNGLADMKRVYITKENPEKMGKYNIMQIAVAWGIAFIVLVLFISGEVLHRRAGLSVGTGDAARTIHIIAFIIMIAFIIFHAMFAFMAINREALKAMFATGMMKLDYIRKKHPSYYKEIKK